MYLWPHPQVQGHLALSRVSFAMDMQAGGSQDRDTKD